MNVAEEVAAVKAEANLVNDLGLGPGLERFIVVAVNRAAARHSPFVPFTVPTSVPPVEEWKGPDLPAGVPEHLAGAVTRHRPMRGDAVEIWLKQARDKYEAKDDQERWAYQALDDLLDAYRLAADTGEVWG